MSNNRAAPPSRAVAVIVGAIVVISILALVAVIATSSSDDEAVDQAEQSGLEQQRPVSVEGPHVPVLADGDDPAVGTTIPTVEGQTFAGEPVTIAADGTPRLVVFLAHWCPHCQAEVPRLVEFLDGRDTVDGVQIVGVATNTDPAAPNFPPSAWLAEEGWPVPTMADDAGNHAAEALGLSSFPYYVAVDGEGRVVARASGELTEDNVQALIAVAGGV
jgi:thiol-disulfide isomerase/thioredoxin